MKKSILLFAAALFFLSGCQSDPTDQTAALTPAPTSASPDISSPIPSPSLTLSPIPTETGSLQDGILYRPIVVEGITEIRQKEGEGIELDLNGDGVAERLYTCEEGIFINGIKQEIDYKWKHLNYTDPKHPQEWEVYWIVDVDTSDSYYNLIFHCNTVSFDEESLTYYDGTLRQIAEQDLFYGSGFSKAEYYGDGTYLMTDDLWDFMGQQYPTDIEYRLAKDTETGTIISERITEFMALRNPYPLALLDNITMYTEPDLNGKSFIAKPQLIFVTAASDNWVQILLEDYTTRAWIYVEHVWNEEGGYMMDIIDHEKNVRDIFSGFSNAG